MLKIDVGVTARYALVLKELEPNPLREQRLVWDGLFVPGSVSAEHFTILLSGIIPGNRTNSKPIAKAGSDG